MAAPVRAPPTHSRPFERYVEAYRRQDCRDNHRKNGEASIVANGQADLEGKHCNEMRPPDTAARHRSCRAEPEQPLLPRGYFDALEHAHRARAGKKAQQSGKRDKQEIVLPGNTTDDAQHMADGAPGR